MRALLLAAVLRAAPAASVPPDPVEERREAVAREMLGLGSEIRRALEAADPAALVARIPPEGLRCAGRIVLRRDVAQALADRGTWLHGALFGGPGYAPAAGAAPSVRDFLLRAGRDVEVEIGFVADRRAAPVGRPCFQFRPARGRPAPGGAPPDISFCFERRGAAWLFTESLFPCG
ncbi:MAG TPA: hypothetical protein VLU43_11705 [Anaeromyxobacteraceae bacterium]|nr:hypothetical protein [Anaeromyxobacteraceae bacterium]